MATIINNITDLPKDIENLLREAQAVAKNAYNKYSNFLVGAAVMTKSGNVYKGTFLENSSFGLTICAEPAAIMAANSNGDFEISSIAIVGGDPVKDKGEVVTPCGRCRQIIYEASNVSGIDIDIYCSNLNLSQVLITKISELLPLPFFKTEFSN